MPSALVRQAFRPGFGDKHRLRVPLRPRWQKQKHAAGPETRGIPRNGLFPPGYSKHGRPTNK